MKDSATGTLLVQTSGRLWVFLWFKRTLNRIVQRLTDSGLDNDFHGGHGVAVLIAAVTVQLRSYFQHRDARVILALRKL